MTLQTELYRHPDTDCTAVQSLRAELRIRSGGSLHLRYSLTADLSRIRVPVPKTPQPADGLWRHTCFEAFFATDGDSRYHEFNFSPSGQWAAYAFSSYRIRRPWTCRQSPNIRTQLTHAKLVLDAEVAAADLPPNGPGGLCRLGLTAVVEARDGCLTYWALHHSGGQPDFHRRESFARSILHPAT
ncbi:MAG: DOMON-like domain-containing protein [Gammaproteobacteria bacterium]